MNKVAVEIDNSSVDLAKGLNNLVEGNFIFSDYRYLIKFLRYYFRPDADIGGTSYRTGEGIILRLMIIDIDNNLRIAIIIEQGKIFYYASSPETWAEPDQSMIDTTTMLVDFLLPNQFPMVYVTEDFDSGLILSRSVSSLRSWFKLANPSIQQTLLAGELGLVNPSRPPGPDNLPLKDVLHFFRFPMIEEQTLRSMIMIFLTIRDQNVRDDIGEFGGLNLTIDLGSELGDILDIHPPSELKNANYDQDRRIIHSVSTFYKGPPDSKIVYLSDGRQITINPTPPQSRPTVQLPALRPIAGGVPGTLSSIGGFPTVQTPSLPLVMPSPFIGSPPSPSPPSPSPPYPF